MARHEMVIPRWHPARLNDLMGGGHWGHRHILKRDDADIVAVYSRVAAVPKATSRRRVGLVITLGPRQRAADPDAYWKSLLDALVACGLLLDDNRQSVELAPVGFVRGLAKSTTIILEDVT